MPFEMTFSLSGLKSFQHESNHLTFALDFEFDCSSGARKRKLDPGDHQVLQGQRS